MYASSRGAPFNINAHYGKIWRLDVEFACIVFGRPLIYPDSSDYTELTSLWEGAVWTLVALSGFRIEHVSLSSFRVRLRSWGDRRCPFRRKLAC